MFTKGFSLHRLNITKSKIKFFLKDFLAVFILFGLIMQSGGGLLRNSSLLVLLLILSIYVVIDGIRFSSNYIFLYCYMIASITISAIVAIFQDVSLGKIIAYNFSMYFIIFLYFAAVKKIIYIDAYIKASLLFSIIIIILNIAPILGFSKIELMKPKLIQTFNGIWGPKPFGSVVIWIAYFQGTLALIPACIYCLYVKKNISFFICFLGILLSGSRFGLLVVLLFYLLFNIKKMIKVVFILGVFFLLGWILNNPVINSLLSVFNDSDGGVSIRAGHLRGILELFDYKPYYLITGQGPGSQFYSYGFKEFADTCEISQFDFLRKYGLLFSIIIFIAVILFSIFLISNTDKKGKAMGWSILAHFTVSISNPVITSLPFMSFLAISISYYFSYRKKQRGFQCEIIHVQ